ncbi:hypothetical protein AYI69_g10103, partial [Smittium culicis]
MGQLNILPKKRLNLLRERAAAALPTSSKLPPDPNLSPKITSSFASDITTFAPTKEPTNNPINDPIYEKHAIRATSKELNS